jgi:hypothetical protein
MDKSTVVRLSVLAATAAVLALTALYIIPEYQAFAIKRFFNCMTAVANKTGTLTIGDINTCYYKKYPELAGHLGGNVKHLIKRYGM